MTRTPGTPLSRIDSLYVPFKACAAAFRGNENANVINLRLKDAEGAADAIVETRTILEGLRKQRGETTGSFNVISSIERMGELNLVLNAIKIVVGLVGGIGLFVGAVGVANVLLVSVRERRAGNRDPSRGRRDEARDLRRVPHRGARDDALRRQRRHRRRLGADADRGFIPQVPAGARPHISIVTALTALTLLTLVGLVAGVWPAKRAAAVYPAEALRAD